MENNWTSEKADESNCTQLNKVQKSKMKLIGQERQGTSLNKIQKSTMRLNG